MRTLLSHELIRNLYVKLKTFRCALCTICERAFHQLTYETEGTDAKLNVNDFVYILFAN